VQHLWAPSPSKKVKLICSFGGKILPRPSDCVLSYIGGHTCIISVPMDISFADLIARMADITGGGPVVLKCHLPNEDLDALISVSCAEDLCNMMDEYAADGSANIKVFLFSPAVSSDVAGAPQHLWAPPSPTKKVKLICSFGGKILPRPSDCVLSYVGGHTRIISVPKDIPFADLITRLADVTGGGPIVLKCHLPNEDLDALISVSCAEDLDNMMDEYAAEGSAKIRVFLFSPSVSSDAAGVGDLSDTGNKYDIGRLQVLK
jgi:hypothetical protein